MEHWTSDVRGMRLKGTIFLFLLVMSLDSSGARIFHPPLMVISDRTVKYSSYKLLNALHVRGEGRIASSARSLREPESS
eukprot:scaffold22701_cov123-Cylindrotheca_fusiformis.AAC.16